MSKNRLHDISIGKDQWIAFVDVDGRQDRAVCIDHLISPFESFWTALEVHCVAECCGIDAFSLWSEDVREAAASVETKALAEGLAALRAFVEHSGPDIFVSRRLNNYFDRHVLLQIIDHIRQHALSSPVA